MLRLFSQEQINNFITKKNQAVKLGENVALISDKENLGYELENTSCQFVILGIPEDIGIKVNGGIGGAHLSFFPAMEALLNIEENQFISGKNILLIGYLDYLETVGSFIADDDEKGHYLVKQIDKDVCEIIEMIASYGKTPIVIGGGQNSAYGILKGMATAKKTKVNAINLDVHTDLHKSEIRDSSNSFLFALEEGFLDRYFMFGLHENYTPQYIFDYMHDHINIEYNMFEEMAVYGTTSFKSELQRAQKFIADKTFGVEIDVDAIANFPSNISFPTGFSPQHARKFVHALGKLKNASYLHISEANPIRENTSRSKELIGKFISYLISDFIKAKHL